MHFHDLIPCHATADGDDVKADMVRRAMQEANLSEKDINEFNQSDLLAMYRGGYTSAYRIQNAKRISLEKFLDLALVDIIETQRGDSCSVWKPPKMTHVPHGLLAMLMPFIVLFPPSKNLYCSLLVHRQRRPLGEVSREVRLLAMHPLCASL